MNQVLISKISASMTGFCLMNCQTASNFAWRISTALNSKWSLLLLALHKTPKNDRCFVAEERSTLEACTSLNHQKMTEWVIVCQQLGWVICMWILQWQSSALFTAWRIGAVSECNHPKKSHRMPGKKTKMKVWNKIWLQLLSCFPSHPFLPVMTHALSSQRMVQLWLKLSFLVFQVLRMFLTTVDAQQLLRPLQLKTDEIRLALNEQKAKNTSFACLDNFSFKLGDVIFLDLVGHQLFWNGMFHFCWKLKGTFVCVVLGQDFFFSAAVSQATVIGPEPATNFGDSRFHQTNDLASELLSTENESKNLRCHSCKGKSNMNPLFHLNPFLTVDPMPKMKSTIDDATKFPTDEIFHGWNVLVLSWTQQWTAQLLLWCGLPCSSTQDSQRRGMHWLLF